MGTAISTGNTLTSGSGTKNFDIFGDGTKGIQAFYASYPGGGDVTIELVWTGFSGSATNSAQTALTIGDDNTGTPEALFQEYRDAVYYPRIILTYTTGGEGEGEGEASTHNFFFLAKRNLILLQNRINDHLVRYSVQLKDLYNQYADTKIVLSSSAAILSVGLYLNYELRK